MHLQLQHLCRVSGARKDSLVRQALVSLPKGLHDTYARIVQQITNKPEYERSLATRCLRWVLYAQRPLYVEELQYALATFEEGTNAKDFELDDLEFVFGACANLVVRQRVDDYSFVARPAHYSVQEYFTGNQSLLQSPVFKLSLNDRIDAHTNLLGECLTHLRQPMMFAGEYEPTDYPGCWLAQDVFLNYAARSFDKHLRHLRAADPGAAGQHIRQLLSSDPAPFRSIINIRAMPPSDWIQCYHMLHGDWAEYSRTIEM